MKFQLILLHAVLAQATIKGNKTDLSAKSDHLSQEHGKYNILLEEEDDFPLDKDVIENQYYHSRLYSTTDTSSVHAAPTSSSVTQHHHSKPTASLIYDADQDNTPYQTSTRSHSLSHSSVAEKNENATPIAVPSESHQASSNSTAKETVSTNLTQPIKRLDSTSTAAKESQKPSNVKYSANSVISINVESSSTLLNPSMLAMLPLLAFL